MKLFSVIIPVYNAENYLEQCIDSVLGQTYTHFELILVNDGSSDLSGKICDEYANSDTRVRVQHQQNAGVSFTRNQGLALARGEYIVFIDSDDYVENHMLEILYNSFQSSYADMVICGINFVYYSAGNIKTSREEIFPYSGTVDDFGLCRNFQEMFNCNAFSSSCNKAYRTNVIKDNEIWFNGKLFLYEDLEFVLRYLMFTNKICFVSSALYNYRNDLDESHLKNRNSDNFDKIDLIARTLVALNTKKEQITSEQLKGLNTIIYSLYLYAMSINLSCGKYSVSKVREMINALNQNDLVNKYRKGKLGVSYHYKLMDVCIQGKRPVLLVLWNQIIEYWIKLRLKYY